MPNESNHAWLLPARVKADRLASEAEAARTLAIETQAETHRHAAKIRDLNALAEKLTANRQYFNGMAGGGKDEAERIGEELAAVRAETAFYEQALTDGRNRYAVTQQAAGIKGELARAARTALETIEGVGSVGAFFVNGKNW